MRITWISDNPQMEHVGNSRVCREMTSILEKDSEVEMTYIGFDCKERVGKKTKYTCSQTNITREIYLSSRTEFDVTLEYLSILRPDVVVLSHDCFLFPYAKKIKEMLPGVLLCGLFTLDGAPVSQAWKPILDACDIIFTPSQWAKKEFQGFNPGYHVEVVPHGVSPDFSPAKNREELKAHVDEKTKNAIHLDVAGKFTCFYVGHNQDRKGVGAARDAWVKFAEDKDDVRWLLLMHSDPNPVNHAYPLELFVHPSIIHLDATVSEEDIIGFYRISDHLLYPTMGDGFSLICLEALACACTPIVTNWSSQTDFCNERNSVLLNAYNLNRGGYSCYRAFPRYEEIYEKLQECYKAWKKNKDSICFNRLEHNGIMEASKYRWEYFVPDMLQKIKEHKQYANKSIAVRI